jgi:hypothetical protein
VNLQIAPTSYVLLMTHEDVQEFVSGGRRLSETLPHLTRSLRASTGIIDAINTIGGNSGVEIYGGSASQEKIIVPSGKGILGDRLQDEGRGSKLIENRERFTVYRLPELEPQKARDVSRDVHCDEGNIGTEETLQIVTAGSSVYFKWAYADDGIFTADGDDRLVYANRSQVLRDEWFTWVKNADGRLSFQCWMGTWMSSDRNRGKRLTVDRSVAGEWEMFTVEFPGQGFAALKDSENQYASVN